MANSVVIKPVANFINVSLFDVYTTTYFLSANSTLEEHKEIRDEPVEEEVNNEL